MWSEALAETRRMWRDPKAKGRWEPYKVSILYHLGRYEEAVKLAESAESCRDSPVRAVALTYIGREEEALRLAKEFVVARNDGAERFLGKVYEITGDLENALLCYERAAGRVNSRSECIRHVARVLTQLGDYREARVAWEQAIRLAKLVRAEDLEQLAVSNRALGNEAEAAEAMNIAAAFRERDRTKSEELGIDD